MGNNLKSTIVVVDAIRVNITIQPNSIVVGVGIGIGQCKHTTRLVHIKANVKSSNR